MEEWKCGGYRWSGASTLPLFHPSTLPTGVAPYLCLSPGFSFAALQSCRREITEGAVARLAAEGGQGTGDVRAAPREAELSPLHQEKHHHPFFSSRFVLLEDWQSARQHRAIQVGPGTTLLCRSG